MNFLKTVLYISIVLLLGQSCDEVKKGYKAGYEDATKAMEETSSTDADKIPGWHIYNKTGVSAAWEIDDDGVISFDKSRGEGGDLVTNEEYENFEMTLDWKISDCGNSGIFWNIVESKEYGAPYLTAPEMQVLDNKCHPDAKIVTHRAGDLYDMIETSVVNVKPAGEWNSIKIRSENASMTFWQNDEEIVSFKMHDANWDAMVAKSKFKDWDAFGKATKGKIGLQDHGDKVWFKNINITRL